MWMWNYTCETQSKRIREKYLHAVLRQDVSCLLCQCCGG